MDFQYLEHFKKLSIKCPPSHFRKMDIPLFRWVYDDINDERNFMPRTFLVPVREIEKIDQISDPKKRDALKCTMLALSMFISEEAALTRFNEIKATMGNVAYKRPGSNIAFLDIAKKDGVNDLPNDVGHFSHHPVVDHHYEQRFKIVSKL